jgi:hypothetical protein
MMGDELRSSVLSLIAQHLLLFFRLLSFVFNALLAPTEN